MPQKVKKEGPKPVEDAAEETAEKMNERLRVGRIWRKNMAVLLKEEYSRFGWATSIGGTLGVQTLWEYYWLVHTTNQYLRSNWDPVLGTWCYKRVTDDLVDFNEQLIRLRFEDREWDTMREAVERILRLKKRWKELLEEARG